MNSSQAEKNLGGVGSTVVADEASDLVEGLSGRELDAAVAVRLMGWSNVRYDFVGLGGVRPVRGYGDGVEAVPKFSSDMVAAMTVENKVEQLGLIGKYIKALLSETHAQHLSSVNQICWRVAHATAEQRCRAALAAIEATHQDGEAATT